MQFPSVYCSLGLSERMFFSFFLTFQGGHEFIFMMDMYGMSLITLLFIATFETISVAWVYGETPPTVSMKIFESLQSS